MTALELRRHLNNTYGLDHPWPKTMEVDAETYANCCQYVFNKLGEHTRHPSISLGPNNGIYFKGVELIYAAKT